MVKNEKITKATGVLAGVSFGIIVSIVGLIVFLSISGNVSIINSINRGLLGICNSGWPLVGFFNPTSGIVPMILIIGLFIVVIALVFGTPLLFDKTQKIK